MQCNPEIFFSNPICVDLPPPGSKFTSTEKCLKAIEPGAPIPIDPSANPAGSIDTTKYDELITQARDTAQKFFLSPGANCPQLATNNYRSTDDPDLAIRARECSALKEALDRLNEGTCAADFRAKEKFESLRGMVRNECHTTSAKRAIVVVQECQSDFLPKIPHDSRENLTIITTTITPDEEPRIQRTFRPTIYTPPLKKISNYPLCQAFYERLLLQEQLRVYIAKSIPDEIWDVADFAEEDFVDEQGTAPQDPLEAIQKSDEASDTKSEPADSSRLNGVPMPRQKPARNEKPTRAPPLPPPAANPDEAYDGPLICGPGYKVVYRGKIPSCERVGNGGAN